MTFPEHLKAESERGQVLISAAMIDDLLLRTLVAFLIEGGSADKLLTGFNAPIGTLSARIEMTAASEVPRARPQGGAAARQGACRPPLVAVEPDDRLAPGQGGDGDGRHPSGAVTGAGPGSGARPRHIRTPGGNISDHTSHKDTGRL